MEVGSIAPANLASAAAVDQELLHRSGGKGKKVFARQDSAAETREANEELTHEHGRLKGSGKSLSMEETTSGGMELSEDEGIGQIHGAKIALVAEVNELGKALCIHGIHSRLNDVNTKQGN